MKLASLLPTESVCVAPRHCKKRCPLTTHSAAPQKLLHTTLPSQRSNWSTCRILLCARPTLKIARLQETHTYPPAANEHHPRGLPLLEDGVGRAWRHTSATLKIPVLSCSCAASRLGLALARARWRPSSSAMASRPCLCTKPTGAPAAQCLGRPYTTSSATSSRGRSPIAQLQ